MRIVAERGGGALADHASAFQHVAAVGQGQRGVHVLLDQEHADARCD